MVVMTSAGMLFASSTQQINLLGRPVGKWGLVKAGVAGSLLAGAVGYLSGLGWSVGMGTGAMLSSPNVQRANAEAWKSGQIAVEREWMQEKEILEREIATRHREADRQQYADYELFKAGIEAEIKQKTSGHYGLRL